MRRVFTKRRTVWAGIAGAAVFAVLLTGFVRAAKPDSDGVYHLKKGEVLEDDLIIAAREVIIDGTIQGDLVAAAGRIEVNGTVTEDAILAAKTIKITGEIFDDARVAGAGVEISGVIGDDLFAAAAGAAPPIPISMGDPEVKDGLLLTDTCRVGGDAAIFCGQLDVDEATRITGNLSVNYKEEANIPDGVAASVKSAKIGEQPGAPSILGIPLVAHVISFFVLTILSSIGFILLCLIVTKFIPKAVVVPAKAMSRSPVWAGLYGLLALALFSFVPLAGCLLACLACFQGPETPLVVMFLDFSAIYLLWKLSPLVTGYWLGKKLTGRTGDKVELTPFVMGTLIITVIGHIPILGYLVYFVSLCLTVGGIVLACWPSSGSSSAACP